MTKNNFRLKHALHNEEVCKHLSLNQDFCDWQITTAFYAALHFVSYKIFPFQVPSLEGKKTLIENLDQYFNYNNPKRLSKHELLSNLVNTNCAGISPDYDWLIDMSMTARYKNYTSDKDIASKAMRLMLAIKKACVTDKEIASL